MNPWLLRPLIAILLVAGAGATWFGWSWWGPLPAPRDASQYDLMRWVVQRDLSLELPELRRELVDRWQGELLAGMDVQGSGGMLSLSQKELVAKNSELLQHDWFVARCEEYATLAPENRLEFLDRQIATVAGFIRVDTEVEATDSPGSRRPTLFEKIDAWIVAAPAEQQQTLNDGVADSLLRWLMTTDLAKQSRDVVDTLAVRLTTRLDSGQISRKNLKFGGTPEERARLRENGLIIYDAWFGKLAVEYAQLPEEKRLAFLDAQVDRWEKWDLAALLAEDPTKLSTNPIVRATEAMKFAIVLQQRIDHAPADEQLARRELFTALQARVVWRTLPPFFRQ